MSYLSILRNRAPLCSLNYCLAKWEKLGLAEADPVSSQSNPRAQRNKFAKLIYVRSVLLFASEVKCSASFPKWQWAAKVWYSGSLWIAIAVLFEIHGMGSRDGEGRWDYCEVDVPLPKKCVWAQLCCLSHPHAVSLCWRGERKHQSLLSSGMQTWLWFVAPRWELCKTRMSFKLL